MEWSGADRIVISANALLSLFQIREAVQRNQRSLPAQGRDNLAGPIRQPHARSWRYFCGEPIICGADIGLFQSSIL
jgi:hypothetical protein